MALFCSSGSLLIRLYSAHCYISRADVANVWKLRRFKKCKFVKKKKKKGKKELPIQHIDLHNRDNSYQKARPCDVICLSRLKYLENKKKLSRNCQITFLKTWEGVCRILLCCSQFLRGIWLGIERRLASLFRLCFYMKHQYVKVNQKKKNRPSQCQMQWCHFFEGSCSLGFTL